MAAPAQQAIQAATDARNQQVMAQYESQKQMELARAQHQMQLQLEAMRDARVTQMTQANAASRMALLKEQGAFKNIAQGNTTLTRLGAAPIYAQPGESNDQLLQRIQDAAKNKLSDNIKQDSLVISNLNGNIANQEAYLNHVKSGLTKYTEDPKVQASAQSLVNSQLQDWLSKVAPNRQDVLDALAQRPDAADPKVQAIIMQNAGLGQAYNDFYNQALIASAASASKIPDITDKINASGQILAQLYREKQARSMMAGDNGRMVPKPWWGEAENAGNVHDLLSHDPSAIVSYDPENRTWVSKPNPNYHPDYGPSVQQAGFDPSIPVTQQPSPATRAAMTSGAPWTSGAAVVPPLAGAPAAVPNLTQAPVTFANSGLVGVTRNAIQQAPGAVLDAAGNFINNNTQIGDTWRNFVHPPMPAGPAPGNVMLANMAGGANRFLFGTNGSPAAAQAPQPVQVVQAPQVQPMGMPQPTNAVNLSMAPPAVTPIPMGSSISPMAMGMPMLDPNSQAAMQSAQDQINANDQNVANAQQYNNMMSLYGR
jgi:hypothetical protein